MEPGSANHWRRRALRQGKGQAAMEQVSLWDSAAVEMEAQWITSKMRLRVVRGALSRW